MPKGVPNKRYTPEFKRMVVETMKKEHLSIYRFDRDNLQLLTEVKLYPPQNYDLCLRMI